MTFLELDDIPTADLALELYFAGDAETLDQAAAMAADMQAVLLDVAQEWDQDAGYVLMPEGDLLDCEGMRV